MKEFVKWVIDQLRQPSTWRGIVMLATSAGLVIKPDLMEPIIVAGTGVAGLIGVLFKG
jgi:hypothetical protein